MPNHERAQLVSRLRKVRDDIAGAEDSGYFGPDSLMWRVHQEALVGLGLTRALLLQLAHPFVAQGVADHSAFPADAAARMVATWAAGSYLIFGSRAQADRVAAQIRGIHARVHGMLAQNVGRWRAGTPYSAEDPEALLWVLVTLAETSLTLYEKLVRPLSPSEQASYLDDAERFGAMIDVPRGRLPRSLAGLRQLIEAEIDAGTVCVGPRAIPLASACLVPPVPGANAPLMWPYRSLQRTMCQLLLPRGLRRQFSEVLGPGPNFPARALEAFVRATVRNLPLSWRADPLALAALRRQRAVAVRFRPNPA